MYKDMTDYYYKTVMGKSVVKGQAGKSAASEQVVKAQLD